MDRQDGQLVDTSQGALARLGTVRRTLPSVFQKAEEMGPRPYHRACQWRDALGEQPTAVVLRPMSFRQDTDGRGCEVIELSEAIAKRRNTQARANYGLSQV